MYDVRTNKKQLIHQIMGKEHKHQGAWGYDAPNHLPGLFGFMAPRVLGMIGGIAVVFILISMVQAIIGMHPILIRELLTQLFN